MLVLFYCSHIAVMPVSQSVSQPVGHLQYPDRVMHQKYASLTMYSMYYYFGRFDPPRVLRISQVWLPVLSCPVHFRYFPSLTRRRALDPRMPHQSCSLRCTGTRLIRSTCTCILCIIYIYIYLHLSTVLYSVLSLNGNMPVLSAHTLLTCHLNGGSVKSRLSGGVDPEDSVPHG